MGLLNNIFKDNKHKISHFNKSGLIDFSKVLPRIKGLYDDENPDPDSTNNREVEISFDDSPIIKPLSKGIGVIYMIDDGNSYKVIQQKHLSKSLTIEELHKIAIANLEKITFDNTFANGDSNSVLMITNGGNFEATMLLASFLWEQLEQIFNADICVAIPANDLLFVTAKNNFEGRKKLRSLVKHYFDDTQTPKLIVRHIYEKVGDDWKWIETC